MKWKPRKVWLKTHLYLGLVVGLVFAMLGLTGSLLVFDHAIDEFMNPHLLIASKQGPRQPLSVIIASARSACPDLPGPQFVMWPRRPDGVYLALFSDQTDPDHPRRIEVTIDPVTAKVLGRREWGAYLMSWIYKLHYTLHLGAAGKTAVGLTGFALMLSVVTGAILWWPILRKGGAWRAFRIKRSSLSFDLHKTVGVAAALVLFVIAFTGAYMIFPNGFKAVVTFVSPETPYPEDLRSNPRPGVTPIDADEAVAIAARVFPEGQFKGLQPPADPEGVFAVTMRRPGEVRRSWGGCMVWIDPYSGEVLAVRDGEDGSASDTFIAWQFPLHNGEAFGLAGRWLVFVSGLTPSLLYVTGLLLWLRKRRSRRRQILYTDRRLRQPAASPTV